MEFMVIAFFATVALFAVAQPLFSKRKYLYYIEDIFELGDQRQRRYLDNMKATVMENLRELDFDYEMGKLSQEDYERLRQDYMAEAQTVVVQLDDLAVKEEIERLIEGDVKARRKIK